MQEIHVQKNKNIFGWDICPWSGQLLFPSRERENTWDGPTCVTHTAFLTFWIQRSPPTCQHSFWFYPGTLPRGPGVSSIYVVFSRPYWDVMNAWFCIQRLYLYSFCFTEKMPSLKLMGVHGRRYWVCSIIWWLLRWVVALVVLIML